MSKNPSSKDSEPSDAPEDLEELRAVLAGLEAEMDTLEASITHRSDRPEEVGWTDEESVGESVTKATSEVEGVLDDLEDPTNATRGAKHHAIPRGAPEPVFEELGEEDPSVPVPMVGMVTDLNPKPGSARSLVRVKGSGKAGEGSVESDPTNRAREPKPPRGSARKSKREERKRARLEKKAQNEAKKQVQEARVEGRDVDSTEEGSVMEHSDEAALTMDDLDMENPLPEAAYAPLKEHSDLVMDRRRRRLAAEVRAEMKEKELHETWDQDDDAALEESLTRKRFNLPVYLVQALLVMLAGFLVVMGVRTAIKSTQDAKDGEELMDKGSAPGLEAVGLVEAEKALSDYLSAPNWKAKLKFVRQPEIAKERMQRYYAANPGESALTLKQVKGRQYNALDGGDGFMFTCEMEDGTILKVPVVRLEAEAPYFVVDWEALVDYADIGWAEFLEAQRPGSRGIFRLYGCEDDYYAYKFDDPKRDLVLQLYDVERSMAAFGYVEIGTPDWLELRRVLALWKKKNGNLGAAKPKLVTDPAHWLPQAKDWAPMTLEVEFPSEKTVGYMAQLRVVRFVSPNWIVAETAS